MKAKAIRKILGKFGGIEGGAFREGHCHVVDLNEAYKELEKLEKLKGAESQLETDVSEPPMTNAHLKFRAKKPDKPGWWWSKTKYRKPKIAYVYIYHKHYMKVKYCFDDEPIELNSMAESTLWAGPIVEPT
jgi:hypothetical protein